RQRFAMAGKFVDFARVRLPLKSVGFRQCYGFGTSGHAGSYAETRLHFTPDAVRHLILGTRRVDQYTAFRMRLGDFMESVAQALVEIEVEFLEAGFGSAPCMCPFQPFLHRQVEDERQIG